MSDASMRETVASNLGLTAEDLGVSENDGDALDTDYSSETDDGSASTGDGLGDDPRGYSQPDMGEEPRPTRRARDQFGREPKAKEQQPQRIPSSAEVRPDGRGNLVDAKGNVVARAGKEARFYQQAANASRQLQSLKAQADAHTQDLTNRLNRAVEIGREVYSRLEKLQAQNVEMDRLGISPQERLEAMQMVALSKTNPIAALKQVLTRAAARGIDMTELGVQGGDLKSLADMLRGEIQQHMQPLRQRTEQEQAAERQRQQQANDFNNAKVHVSQFFAANPDAKQYLPVLDAVLQRYPSMTLGEIWAKLQLHLTQRGASEARTRSSGAFPNGRGRLPPRSKSSMAPVGQTYEQIARSVMKDVGM